MVELRSRGDVDAGIRNCGEHVGLAVGSAVLVVIEIALIALAPAKHSTTAIRISQCVVGPHSVSEGIRVGHRFRHLTNGWLHECFGEASRSLITYCHDRIRNVAALPINGDDALTIGFYHAMDLPASSERATPAHRVQTWVWGGHAQPPRAHSSTLPLGCGGCRFDC
jgi:hypothetical protein